MAKRKRSTEDISSEIEAITSRTDHINSKIEEAQKQVDFFKSDVKGFLDVFRDVKRELAKPALREKQKAKLLEYKQCCLDLREQLRTQWQHLRMGLQHLREKKQLCEKEKQLLEELKQQHEEQEQLRQELEQLRQQLLSGELAGYVCLGDF